MEIFSVLFELKFDDIYDIYNNTGVKRSIWTEMINKRNCFNDPAWTTTTQRVLGGVGWVVGHIPTTYIQLAGAGSTMEVNFEKSQGKWELKRNP